MTSRETISKWLSLLIRQTELGNVTWRQRGKRDSYYFAGSESVVTIESRDDDELLPYRLRVEDSTGRVSHDWLIFGDQFIRDAEEEAAAEWLAAPARNLYDAVRRQMAGDPIEQMLSDLEDLPPF